MPHFLSPHNLLPLIGTKAAPRLLDVRLPEDAADDPFTLPGAVRIAHTDMAALKAAAGRNTVVICQKGLKISQGVAAALRAEGYAAQALAGGTLGWAAQDAAPRIAFQHLPTGPLVANLSGIEGLACAWIMHRFLAPLAPVWDVSDPAPVADRFDGTALTSAPHALLAQLDLQLPALIVLVDHLRTGTPSVAALWASCKRCKMKWCKPGWRSDGL